MISFPGRSFFKRWSLAYFLFTPSIIENVPQPHKIGEAEYYHSAGDGPKPMVEGISFESNASKNQILNQFDEYLSHHGYVRDSADLDFFEYQYSRDNNKFYLTIEALEGGFT